MFATRASLHLPTTGYLPLLTRYLRPHRLRVAALAALLLAAAALQLAGPQLLRSFIDAALGGAPPSTLARLAAIFFAAALAGQLATVATQYTAEDVGWAATNALRADLAAHCLQLDLGF